MTGITREESYQQLDRINFWIANCDTKSSIVLAFVGVFTPLFITSTPMLDSLKFALHTVSSGHVPFFSKVIFTFSGCTILVTILFVVFTIRLIFKSLTATVGNKVTHAAGVITNSDLFFSSISNKTFADYYRSVSHTSEQDVMRDIYSQIYVNSHICNNKFMFYNLAVKYLKYALLGFLLMSLIYTCSFFI